MSKRKPPIALDPWPPLAPRHDDGDTTFEPRVPTPRHVQHTTIKGDGAIARERKRRGRRRG